MLPEELGQHVAALDALEEDDDLVELERVEERKEALVLLLILELDVVLPEAVQGQLRVVVDEDLNGLSRGWGGHRRREDEHRAQAQHYTHVYNKSDEELKRKKR